MMKLNEKIYHCRKKAGLSQEALAEKIGVSRQAISKWETGEASPEISKLPLLASTFGVTADWLLAEDDDVEAEAPEGEDADGQNMPPPRRQYSDAPANHMPDWVENLPGVLGRLVKRFGWLLGVYIALCGAGATALGAVFKAIVGSMSSSLRIVSSGSGPDSMLGGVTWLDESGAVLSGPFTNSISQVNPYQPFDIFCTFLIVLGLVLLIGGAALAWYLKRKGTEA